MTGENPSLPGACEPARCLCISLVIATMRACLENLDRPGKIGNRDRFRANPRRITGLFDAELTGIESIVPLLHHVHGFSSTL
jgi:hypothetical protein